MNATPKKRRWWVYAGIALLTVVVLAGVAIALAIGYANHLIRAYTETTPVPLPPFTASIEAREQLKSRWSNFQETLKSGKYAPPFQVSSDDLNVFLSNFEGLRDRFYLRILDHRLQGQFSFPLDKTGQGKLRGRHLNGLATFNLVFEDGLVTLSVASVEANHKPIPRWLLGRLQRHNLLAQLDGNLEVAELLQKLDRIEVNEGRITLTPAISP